MRRQPVKKIDAILLLAKATLGDRRRRSSLRLVVIVAVLLVFLGLTLFAVRPRPDLPPLLVAAFDQITLPNETVSLCAQVEPVDPSVSNLDLTGCDLYFLNPQTQELLGKVTTKRAGSASLLASFPASDRAVEIVVRQRGDEFMLAVHIWPAETAILVVDADHALADIDDERLWTTNNLDIRPHPGVAQALQAVRAKFRIAYLTGAADRPSRYRKLRAWLSRGTALGPEQIPDGPILAPACYPGASDPAVFSKRVITDLTNRFQGNMVGVVTRPEEATIYRASGLETILVGEATEVPDRVTTIPSWDHLPKQLAK
jgi:hypothetical protein